jgi:hypothetical protein
MLLLFETVHKAFLTFPISSLAVNKTILDEFIPHKILANPKGMHGIYLRESSGHDLKELC